MNKIIYIENAVKNLARVKKIVKRFKNPSIIYIDKYTEVFNRKNQNFTMQKTNPAIILAKKYGNFLLETPKNYSIGRKNNYYFSYMYNCIFDCRYCFLQGLYKSSNLVIFVNYMLPLNPSEYPDDTGHHRFSLYIFHSFETCFSRIVTNSSAAVG